jgi:hypothetical protein
MARWIQAQPPEDAPRRRLATAVLSCPCAGQPPRSARCLRSTLLRDDGEVGRACLRTGAIREVERATAPGYPEHAAFLPRLSQDQFFGLLARSHVLIDSPGFSGFNTVMQAVECACPVVAWEGDALRSRFASGVLRQLRLDDWVCDDAVSFARSAPPATTR